MVEQEAKSIPLTHIYLVHDRSISWRGMGTSIKRCGIKLVLWAEPLPFFPGEMVSHASIFHKLVKCQLSHTTGRKPLLYIKHALILNSIHDILNLRDICHMYNISSIKETRESQLSF